MSRQHTKQAVMRREIAAAMRREMLSRGQKKRHSSFTTTRLVLCLLHHIITAAVTAIALLKIVHKMNRTRQEYTTTSTRSRVFLLVNASLNNHVSSESPRRHSAALPSAASEPSTQLSSKRHNKKIILSTEPMSTRNLLTPTQAQLSSYSSGNENEDSSDNRERDTTTLRKTTISVSNNTGKTKVSQKTSHQQQAEINYEGDIADYDDAGAVASIESPQLSTLQQELSAARQVLKKEHRKEEKDTTGQEDYAYASSEEPMLKTESTSTFSDDNHTTDTMLFSVSHNNSRQRSSSRSQQQSFFTEEDGNYYEPPPPSQDGVSSESRNGEKETQQTPTRTEIEDASENDNRELSKELKQAGSFSSSSSSSDNLKTESSITDPQELDRRASLAQLSEEQLDEIFWFERDALAPGGFLADSLLEEGGGDNEGGTVIAELQDPEGSVYGSFFCSLGFILSVCC